MDLFNINNIKPVIEILDKASEIILMGHHNPDGDSLGACLALYQFFKDEYKVKTIMPNTFPDFLKWMKCADEILIYENSKELCDKYISMADIIFCIDFNESERVGNAKNALLNSKAKKIMIDHHPDHEQIADFYFIDTNASSASELVYYFMTGIGNKNINSDIAESLFTGIMMDTGCFCFNSSNPATYITIAELLALGIDKERIFSNVYDNFSADRMRLMGYLLDQKLVVDYENKYAYISVTQSELKQYNFRLGDSEGFVNLPLSVKGVVFSVFLMEKDDYVKLSFRSKGGFNVNEFARTYYSGGGHKNAAGGKSESTLNEAITNLQLNVAEFTRNNKNE